MQNKMKVSEMISVIIPTYNEEKYVRSCLDNLKKCKTKNYEIIIVDAKSTDKTIDICREYTDKILIEEKKEGFAIARNKGADIAKGEIVAFLDADSVPKEGWLNNIEKHLKDDTVAVCGPVEYNINWLDYGAKIYIHANNLSKILFNICLIYGNNSAWKKKVFLEVGGFRDVIGEDFDFCLRARKYAKKINTIPDMKVRLSTRRFEKEGLFKTHCLWLKSNIYALFGKSMSLDDYKHIS